MAAEARAPRFAVPLRRALVMITVGSIALAAVALGLLYTTFTTAILYDHIDQRLRGAIERIDKPQHGTNSKAKESEPEESSESADAADSGDAASGDAASGDEADDSDFDHLLMKSGRGNPDLAVLISADGEFIAAAVNDGGIQMLTAASVARIVEAPPVGSTVTMELGSELGSYRLTAVRSETDGTIVALGIPLADTETIIAEAVRSAAWASLAVAVLAGVLVMLLVRRALRPLEEVVETASLVSRADLFEDREALRVRVAPEASDERTEAGRVGAALNRLLDHITDAFSQREKIENRLRVFAADASHELRTPLASIRGYAELTRLSGEDLPPDSAQALGRIEQEATRMGGIVENLLLLARLDQQLPLREDEVDIAVLVRDAVSDARVVALHHEIELEGSGEPMIVIGDADHLREAIGNVVSNAWQHTPAGTRVCVRVGREQGEVTIEVTDFGPGLPENFQEQLFERFARADDARTREQGGAGLGLAIAKSVLEAHHGSISLVSTPASTTFLLRIPVATA